MSKLATEFDSPDASPGFLLWQITNKWQAQQRQALAKFDLTHVQFVLLASLVWATDQATFTQKQLADHAKTDVMMASQVLRTLEKKGLINRTPSRLDARSMTLRPTKKGIILANKAVIAVEAVDKEFFSVLGADLPFFIQAMQQLIPNT